MCTINVRIERGKIKGRKKITEHVMIPVISDLQATLIQ
jgi:hypothetical protein